MPNPLAPLLFPEVFYASGLWHTLGKKHGLTERDFRWLAHTRLTSATLRKQQTPAMSAERILLHVAERAPIPLPGSFVLSATPDDEGHILYTPYGGLKKFENRAALKARLEDSLNDTVSQEDLLAFLALSERKRLQEGGPVSITFTLIEGDVFEELGAALDQAGFHNTRALNDELERLPSLTQVLESVLNGLLRPHFGTLQQSQTRVSFYTDSNAGEDSEGQGRHWLESMSLSEAVLMLYRHQRWPNAQSREYHNPGRKAQPDDQEHWENAVTAASGKLTVFLFRQLEQYWDAPSADGSMRRTFFAQALEDRARAELMIKRETHIIDSTQFDTLHQLIRPATTAVRLPTFESVRLWERQANYVELAGSLMINATEAFLYTPNLGLQTLKDYDDLKDTLQAKFLARGHEDELYALLNLEERSRFLGFREPHVSGERLAGDIFKVLFEAIITKQRQNIEYALQVYRCSDGAVNLHALFDKALDIRPMIHEQLSRLDAQGRWTTQPVLTGNATPSVVLADKAAAAIKTYSDIESEVVSMLTLQPMKTPALQRTYLEGLKPQLAHAWYVGVNAEAKLRMMNSSLSRSLQDMIATVIDSAHPTPAQRLPLNGFRPDAFALSLTCPDSVNLLPLDHCLLITERGGLDPRHSGRAVLWTPAFGLEVFDNVTLAQRELNRRLGDPIRRLSLLENVRPTQTRFHQHYELGSLQLIRNNVLHHQMQSTIDHYLDCCEQVRSRITDPTGRLKRLSGLSQVPLTRHLQLAGQHARAIQRQQTLPSWLGMAPVKEQQLHIELLEQWRHSVQEDGDYLAGVPSLQNYVNQTLTSLLEARFPDNKLDPVQIEITPSLTLAGPGRSLVEHALNHINIAQGTGFTVTSKTDEALPAGLDPKSVTQLLLSLAIPETFARQVDDALSSAPSGTRTAKERFLRQVPWQLLQQSHALKLQQHLSDAGFGFIRQVLDMPDALARTAVTGAHAIAYPLSLIKTAGAAAVNALGMYIFGPGAGHTGPRVLYSPYAERFFHEFEDDDALIAALNTPGALQDLLVRRLPESQRSLFISLLETTFGERSEMTLNVSSIAGNFLEHLFNDNVELLKQLLSSQNNPDGQSDWEAALGVFSDGLRQVSRMAQGKIDFLHFLWSSFEHIQGAEEALQNHHWKKAMDSFIHGALDMVEIALIPEMAAESSVAAPLNEVLVAPSLGEIDLTAPLRTALRPFEGTSVSLKDLEYSSKEGIYRHPSSNRHYAACAGKVYQVVKNGASWVLKGQDQQGPALVKTANALVVDPHRIVHFGKTLSRMYKSQSYSRMRRSMMNIEARGMAEIRSRHPEKARMLVQAIDLARFYAFNCLHNLTLHKTVTLSDRVQAFLEDLFDIDNITDGVVSKIAKIIEPLCKALVTEDEDLMNSDRFIVGSNRLFDDVIAFVFDGDKSMKVHFTEHFFDQQLDHYLPHISKTFDLNGHARASTLIHEFAHQFSKALDIVTFRAREPFSDLILTDTPRGTLLQNDLEGEQRTALSLQTPRAQLFATLDVSTRNWMGFDRDQDMATIYAEVLKMTGGRTLQEARDAFCDQGSPEVRIDVILRNADAIARLICEIGRRLDPVP
ncbi:MULTISPECIES: dermonecrotic toxin domain-containing protein [unclassified Pseudomonas]|uniref:dermonecrotic toxin domain-containing protein n=1 Tax=unclassified Pseudomonas TaxID=196821 RepID=UPI000A1D8500|nr:MULTISPECIES: DUF6543 domain-containing protein [unclassified Pseudomonas]